MTAIRLRRLARILPIALALVVAAGGAYAQTLTGSALAQALKGGGYVVVMRHASSPQTPPTAAEADRDNTQGERQLDPAGRAFATAMGEAVRRLGVRFGEVWSSPTYRARETVRLAGLPTPRTAPELGDQGHSMRAVGADQGAWLRARANTPPAPGTDTLVVTHAPNIGAAFGEAGAQTKDGEGLVFQPSPTGPARLVGRIAIEDWPKF